MRIIVVVLFIALIFSCSKLDSYTNKNSSFADSARTWWNTEILSTALGININWQNASKVITVNGVRVLEVPVLFPEKILGVQNSSNTLSTEKADSLYTYRSLIIYHKPERGFYCAIMKLMGSDKYNTNASIKVNSFGRMSGSFDGILLLENLNGSFIKGRRYKRGLNPVPISIKPPGPTTELMVCDQVTYNFYQQVCVGGNCSEPRLLSSVTYLENCRWYPEAGEEPPIDYKLPSDGGGGYNPPTETVEEETQEIIIRLSDSCQRATTDRIINGNFSNEIIARVNQIFGLPQKRYNIVIKDTMEWHTDNPTLGAFPPNLDGRTQVAARTNNSLDIRIYINLPPATTAEYIASTFIHEIIHGIYRFETPPGTGGMDHDKMAAYLTVMDSCLRELYPTSLPPSHAHQLNQFGLSASIYGQGLIVGSPVDWNKIVDTSLMYRYGTKGTRCK